MCMYVSFLYAYNNNNNTTSSFRHIIWLARTSEPRVKSVFDPDDDRRKTGHITYTRVEERGMGRYDQ